MRYLYALLVALVVLSGCTTYKATSVKNLEISDAFKASPPKRTAFLGLIIEPTSSVNLADSLQTNNAFMLSRAVPENPLLHCIDIVDEAPAMIPSGEYRGRKSFRKPISVLEAYCVCHSDVSILNLFTHQPTGFGREQVLKRRTAIADSLAILIHAYITNSIEDHLGECDHLGELLGHAETVHVLLERPGAPTYEDIISDLQTQGHLSPEVTAAVCEELGVEALLCVAVVYGHTQVLHTSQYGSWYTYALRVETDAHIYGSGSPERLVRVQFARTHDKHISGLDDVGKMIKKGLEGKLRSGKSLGL